MAEKNILIKRHNGIDWDNIYPVTKGKNVILADSSNVEDKLARYIVGYVGKVAPPNPATNSLWIDTN